MPQYHILSSLQILLENKQVLFKYNFYFTKNNIVHIGINLLIE